MSDEQRRTQERTADELVGVVLSQTGGVPINIANIVGVRSLGQLSTFGLSNLSNLQRLNQTGESFERAQQRRQQLQNDESRTGIEPSCDAMELEVDDHERITFAEGSPFITLSKDRMSAWPKTSVPNASDTDSKTMASISSTLRWNRQLDVAYYEVALGRRDMGVATSSIRNPRGSGVIIGLAANKLSHNKPVGSVACSFGYKGSDGHVYKGTEESLDFGPQFKAGDTVGCGIVYESGSVFFTRNGSFVGAAGSFVSSVGVYPAVSIPLESDDLVTANFGRHAFKFDLKSYVQELSETRRNTIGSMSVPSSAALDLVKEYLLYNGYVSVFDVLKEDGAARAESCGKFDELAESSRMREIIRRHVTKGELEDAMRIIKEAFSPFAELKTDEEKMVWFELNYQQFIELIKGKKVMEALLYMRGTLTGLELPGPQATLLLEPEDAHGLIAYEDPSTSRSAHLLSQERRQRVADVTNRLLLGYEQKAQCNDKTQRNGATDTCRLERLVRHLTQLLAVRRDVVNKGSGKPFDVAAHM